jgi:ATP-dependent DNA helicase PIF1
MSFHSSFAARTILNTVLQRLESAHVTPVNLPNVYMVTGEGGCGKTRLYIDLVNYLVANDLMSLSVAWTGIAAELLPNGRTCHSAFCLPFTMDPESLACMDLHSRKADVLRKVALIIWDEVSMAHKESLRMLDSLLRLVMASDTPFGNKIVLFGGDPRQVLIRVS